MTKALPPIYKSYKLWALMILTLTFYGCKKSEQEENLIVPPSSSFNENIEWRNILGTAEEEKVNHGLIDQQGNLLVISHPNSGPYLAKVNGENGTLIWESQLSASYGIPLGSTSMSQEDGIDYFICGGTGGSQEAWIAKISGDNGSVIWIKSYEHESQGKYDGLRKLTVGSDGFLYATGFVEANDKASFFASEGGKLLNLKVDPVDGQLIWQQVHEGADCGYNLQEYDGKLYIGAFQSEVGWKLLQLSKQSGGVVSSFLLEGTSEIVPSDFCISEQGTFYFGGHAARTGTGDPFDYTLSHCNGQRGDVWTKYYGNPRAYSTNYIRNELYGIACKNGEVFLFGGSGDESSFYNKTNEPFPSSSTWVAWVARCNAEGTLVESMCYNHDEMQGGNTACEYGVVDEDHLYIFNDTDANYEEGQSDIGIMKVKL